MCLTVVSILALSASPIWGQRSSYDPAGSQPRQPNQPRDSFAEFTLKRINREDTDYGCRLEAARNLLVNETVKSIEFWIVSITFGLLVLSFFMLLHQHEEGERREIIAAGFLAQYHNALLDARQKAEHAIARYNALVHTTNTAAEANLRSQSPDANRTPAPEIRPILNDRGLQSVKASAVASSTKSGGSVAGRSGPGTMKPSLPESEADLLAQITTLLQQLNASHEREKHLQKQLSRAPRPLAPQANGNVSQ